MTFRNCWLFAASTLGVIGLLWADSASAALVQVGGTYRVSGTNFPVSFGLTDVPLDAATHSLAGGLLSVQAEIIDVDVNSEWLVLTFFTPDGSTMASNLNSPWDVLIRDIPFTEPAKFGALFYQYTIDGVGHPDSVNWMGGVLFPGADNNPIDAALGPGFGGISDPPGDPFDLGLFINPFNLISTSVEEGVDPAEFNGFRAAFLVTRADPISAVPEPSSVAIFSIMGLVGLVVGGYRRRRFLLAMG